jgi:hypothetical protein
LVSYTRQAVSRDHENLLAEPAHPRTQTCDSFLRFYLKKQSLQMSHIGIFKKLDRYVPPIRTTPTNPLLTAVQQKQIGTDRLGKWNRYEGSSHS